LNDPTGPYHQAILALITPNNVYRFAERVRRRSTRLIRCKQKNGKNLLAIRDALIMSLYAETAPPGWVNAWCDGSSVTHNNERRAGVGVVIFSQHWDCIAQISRAEGNKTAFEAEIKAVAFTLDTAVAHNITRIRVHTDNKALAHLWRQHRRDARLAEIRKRAANFMKLQICAIPRLHNQAANRLAKQAASSR
jgi:ribonuclease HI